MKCELILLACCALQGLVSVSVVAKENKPMLPVIVKLDPNRPRPLFFMTVEELTDFRKRLANGEKEAQEQLSRTRQYANKAMEGPGDGQKIQYKGPQCRCAALVGLWTGERRYLDWAAALLKERASHGPGSANEAHVDHYHNNFYSFLEAYDYLCAAKALSPPEKEAIERDYFRESMKRTRDHWASKACQNHGVVEDEAAVLAGACLQDEELMRFGLERTFHHLAHDVLDDGSWYQESPLVHDMNVHRFLRIIRACLNSGIDLRTKAIPPVPHPPYPGNENKPHSFGMMAEALIRLSTYDLKIPCSGYYTSLYPYIPARLHTLSEMLSWLRGTEVTREDVANEIRRQGSTLLPNIGYAALRSGDETIGRNYVMMHYGPTDHHPGAMNFVVWADGRFLTADFSRIDGWATPLYRSYVEQTWSHNCIVVDGKSQTKTGGVNATRGGKLVFFGEKPGLSVVHARAEGLYEGVVWERTIALTSAYAVCFDRVISQRPHCFDWMFHLACGPMSVKSPLKALSKPSAISYPHFENVKSYAPEEQTAFLGDCDGVSLSVRVLGAVGDEVALADCPARIKQERDTQLVERVGKIVIRRRGTDVVFLSVYEPIRGEPLVERIGSPRPGVLRLMCRAARVDTIELRGGEAGYIWQSSTNGKETARTSLMPEKATGKHLQ